MVKTAKERNRARVLFIVNGLTIPEISKKTGISKRTLYSWSKKEGWRKIKEQQNLPTPARLKQLVVRPPQALPSNPTPALNIKNALHKKGISLAWIGRMTGHSRQHVSHVLKGERHNPKIACLVAEVLGVKPSDLFRNYTDAPLKRGNPNVEVSREAALEAVREAEQLRGQTPKASNNDESCESRIIPEFVEIRKSLLQLLNSAISKEEAKLQKQGAGVSPKVLSAVARLAEVTALYFQHPAE
jgi:lambda repressor-like predicted transcriptional regulator